MLPTATLLPSLEPLAPASEPLEFAATVLLVEDEDALAELLKCLLVRLKVRVLHAADGAQALQLLAEYRGKVNLAFVDCHLPDIGGPDLCELLRDQVPGLPLLLTSGRDQRNVVGNFTSGGPCAFLPKPYLPADVMRRVSSLLPAAA